jgi:cytochrome b561
MDTADRVDGRSPVSDAADPGVARRYGPVARSVHWLVAALAAIVVSLGWAAGSAPHNTAARGDLLFLHRSVGLTILGLMIFRAVWRVWHPAPPVPPSLGRIEIGLAHLTHLGLYFVFVTMPVAGYLNAAAASHAVSFFGLFSIPPLLPLNQRLSQWAIAIHLLGQYLLYLLVALHVAGGLYHGVIRRDDVLERMLPRRRGARLRP